MSERKVRLLCLDGGGVRGLASLIVLKQLLGLVGAPRPCEYFHMIGGTSTGGLIALMLGRLEMSIDDCISAFTRTMDQIFQSRPSMGFNPFTGRVAARFDAAILERCIKEIIKGEGFDTQLTMRAPKRSPASISKTFVVAMLGEARTTDYFTDYARPGEQKLYTQVRVWEAARATSAATSFFDPITITVDNIPMQFLDGAFGSNNPVFDLWIQAQKVFGSADLEERVRVLLSLGTGIPRMKSFGWSLKKIGKSIIEIATQTQATARSFGLTHSDLFTRGSYFRFNPPDIGIGLEDARKKGVIAARVQAYLSDPNTEHDMRRFATVADIRDPREHIFEHKLSHSVTSIPAKRFYDLGAGKAYIRTDANCYWSRLTLTSYEIYEAVIGACQKGHKDIHFKIFISQFNHQTTPLKLISAIWSRLLRPEVVDVSTSRLPTGLAMAVVYMLHVERFHPNERPINETQQVGLVSTKRRELLKRYNKWVTCQCGTDCGVSWNFAGDVGIWRRGTGERVDEVKERCPVVKVTKKSTSQLFFSQKEVSSLEHIRNKWEMP